MAGTVPKSSFAKRYNTSRGTLAVAQKVSRRLEFNPWFGKIPWRREWQSTPVLFPGKVHGQRSLVSLQSMGSQRVRHECTTNTYNTSFFFHFVISFLIFIFNWWLFYNIGLISVIHKHEWAIGIHISPLESPSHLLPIPTPLGDYRAQVWVPWVKQQIPIGCLFIYVSVYAFTPLMTLTQN